MPARPERDLELFSKLLRQARIAKGLSQEKIAGAVGVAQASVAAWEAGRTEPEREYVFALEDLLGTGDGGLSWPLNYGRVPKRLGRSTKGSSLSTRQAIMQDPGLSDAAKDVLVKSYSLLAKGSKPRSTPVCTTAAEPATTRAA